MNKKWLKLSIVVLVVGVIGVSAVAAHPQGPGGMFGLGGPENSAIAIAAEQLGLEPADLLAELQAGKTIAELAEAQGVSLDSIVEAIVAAHSERLATAVENGRITQEQADAMLATMTENLTARLSQPFESGQGFGGRGFGGPGRGNHFGPMGPGMGFQNGNGNSSTPEATETPST
jgi:hypothetical protein